MQLELVQAGDPVLRQSARPLSSQEIVSAEIRELITSMRETMRKAPGVGLAAPQVGHSLQLAVIEDRPEYTKDASRELLKERERKPVAFHVIINPRLTRVEDATVEFFEGCLSVASMMAIVPRSRKVRVECMDEKARLRVIEASGWYARILQHEIDHLNGMLYIDRMDRRSFTTVENFNRYWKDKPIGEVKSFLL